MPHTLEAHTVFAVQAAPRGSGETQLVPEQTKPGAQSMLVMQMGSQAAPVASHPKWLGQAVGALATQLPLPLQALTVSMPPRQLGIPHAVMAEGKLQAPVLSQSVAPQMASLVAQAALQQFPTPFIPHTRDRHCALAVQGAPSARLLVPPVVVCPLVPPVVPPAVLPVVPAVVPLAAEVLGIG
jgi:hypothetical protein